MSRRTVYARLMLGENTHRRVVLKTLLLSADEGRATLAAVKSMFSVTSPHYIQFMSSVHVKRAGWTLTQLEQSAFRPDHKWFNVENVFKLPITKKRYKVTTVEEEEYTFASVAFLKQYGEVCSWFEKKSEDYITKIYDTEDKVEVELRGGKLVPIAGQVPKEKPKVVKAKVSRPRKPKSSPSSSSDRLQPVALGDLAILPNELVVHIFSFCPSETHFSLKSINVLLKVLVNLSISVLPGDKPSYTVPMVLRHKNVREVYSTIRVVNEKGLDKILSRRLTYMILEVSWLPDIDEIVDWILTHNSLQYLEYHGQGVTFSYTPENGGCIWYHVTSETDPDEGRRDRHDGRDEIFAQLRRLPYTGILVEKWLDKRLVVDKEISLIECKLHRHTSLMYVIDTARQMKCERIVQVQRDGNYSTHLVEVDPLPSVVEFMVSVKPEQLDLVFEIFPNVKRVGVYFPSLDLEMGRENLVLEIAQYKRRISNESWSRLGRGPFHDKLASLLRRLEHMDDAHSKAQKKFRELQEKHPHFELVPIYE